MTDALKPCPFCGGNFVAQGASGGYISVWCRCGARGPEVKFPEDCLPAPLVDECRTAWNRRDASSEVETCLNVVAQHREYYEREYEDLRSRGKYAAYGWKGLIDACDSITKGIKKVMGT